MCVSMRVCIGVEGFEFLFCHFSFTDKHVHIGGPPAAEQTHKCLCLCVADIAAVVDRSSGEESS